MLLVEQQSNEKTLPIELLPKFFKLEERNVWGFSDSEKEKLVDKLSSFLSKIETQPQLLRAQKRRIALRNDSAEEWIESIELIENLWDRTKSSVDQAKAIVSDLPWAKNPEKSYYYDELVNVAITLCKFLESFQQSLDVLDVSQARAILDEVQRYEWLDLEELRKPLIASDYDQESILSSCESPPQPDINAEPIGTSHIPVSSFNEDRSAVELNPNPVSIEDVIEGYRVEKENLNKGMKEVKAVMSACRLAHELLGSSDMASVSRDDVNRIVPKIKLFPANARVNANKKHFDGLDAVEIIEKNKTLRLPLRKEEQAMRDIERASTVYRWAIDHKKIDYNPFEGLCNSKSKVKTKLVLGTTDDDKSKKVPFVANDLRSFFNHPVYTERKIGRNTRENIRLNYQYWVMLIALVTGARPNEICQLRVKDVQVIDDVLCFLIQAEDADQSLKNQNAVRIIPVHSSLIKLGFQQYYDSVCDGRMLFPDLTYTEKSGYYGKVEDWFTRVFSKPMGLSSQSKSFYSFRHTFIFDYQKRSQRSPIIAQLVGHENGNITDDTYGGKFSVTQLKDKIEEFKVDDILKNVLPFRV
ncbi:hypothetical protein BCU85_19305 [Vibrio lentus]|nr:hypothetical protein BCU85_19305 [Vibrio lentus]PMK91601.1 hypothetical protein BCT88_05000 [Vibrio lentus]PML22623.1 hypothetical protein BCT80_11705 [Vibrio lentus]PMM26869.1 hypothetical protein BCT57_19900 [Vibrio lentus]PMM46681.1 hypothetical protein BCT53_07010 [Vibrio lentus]